MYLVTIERKILDGKLVNSPAIEKLQAFSYQLFDSEWSVIDCIPEKGAHFELHLGGYSPFVGKDLAEADCNATEVIAAVLAADSAKAIKWASLLEHYLSCIPLSEQDKRRLYLDVESCQSALMYLNGETEAGTFYSTLS